METAAETAKTITESAANHEKAAAAADVGALQGGLFVRGLAPFCETSLYFCLPAVVVSPPPSPDQSEESYLWSIRRLATNPGYVLLLVTYGLNVGVFYAISTLLVGLTATTVRVELICILIYLSRLLSMQRRAGNSHDHLPLSPSLPPHEEGGSRP